MSTGLHVLEYAPTTDVAEAPAAAPARLGQNVPNPFNPRTRIELAARAGEGPQAATLAVFDIRGRRLVTLFDGVLADGERRELVWDGRDEAGAELPSGVYFARALFGAESETRKMLMLK